jgi:hypothetical protein
VIVVTSTVIVIAIGIIIIIISLFKMAHGAPNELFKDLNNSSNKFAIQACSDHGTLLTNYFEWMLVKYGCKL